MLRVSPLPESVQAAGLLRAKIKLLSNSMPGEYLALLENVKKIKLINQKTLVLTTDKGKTS